MVIVSRTLRRLENGRSCLHHEGRKYLQRNCGSAVIEQSSALEAYFKTIPKRVLKGKRSSEREFRFFGKPFLASGTPANAMSEPEGEFGFAVKRALEWSKKMLSSEEDFPANCR